MIANFHMKIDSPSGTLVPMHVKTPEGWVKVGEGIYDAKNQSVHVEYDPTTKEGELLADSINKIVNPRPVATKTIWDTNEGENVD